MQKSYLPYGNQTLTQHPQSKQQCQTSSPGEGAELGMLILRGSRHPPTDDVIPYAAVYQTLPISLIGAVSLDDKCPLHLTPILLVDCVELC